MLPTQQAVKIGSIQSLLNAATLLEGTLEMERGGGGGGGGGASTLDTSSRDLWNADNR